MARERLSVEELYKKEDREIIFHADDPDLDVITVPLPKAPPPQKIEGYGLHPKHQFFKAEKWPKKVRFLNDEFRSGNMSLQEIWDYLDENQDKYKEELFWIATQIERGLYGHWVYINGKPTFIDGWHYRYLNFWVMPSGLPQYRDRDRKFYHFSRFVYNDPLAYGFNYPKHRREGATTRASQIHYCIISELIRCHGGIQSMTDDHAEKVFQEHIIEPWKELPFFYKPEWDGTSNPKTKLSFTKKSTQISKTGKTKTVTDDLRSSITYKESGVKAYDSWKLHFLHNDECGKSVLVDVYARWQVQKPTIAQGSKIHGFAINTSTVGEFEKGGGRQFKRLCAQSHYGKRGKDGQTTTGLYNFFMSAVEGLDSFVDQYGNSVIGAPTKEQKEYLISKHPELRQQYEAGMGAHEYIISKRKQYEEEGDNDGLNEYTRQFPIYFRECFRQGSKSSGFDMVKIENRLDELAFNNTLKQRGNFEFNDQKNYGAGVYWKEDPNGRWCLSKVLGDAEANNFTYDSNRETYIPLNRNMCAGGDPFKFNKTKEKRKSNGGGAVFLKHNHTVDPIQKPREMWKTNRFVCTYSHRPNDKNEYAMDMLKMCLYHGCFMFPEIDVPLLWDKFEEFGFSGFLLYSFENGKYKNTPGATSSDTTKQQIFTEYMTYVSNDVCHEPHDELIVEIRDVEGPENMTFYDLFTAGGYALLGIKQLFDIFTVEESESDLVDLSQFLKE